MKRLIGHFIFVLILIAPQIVAGNTYYVNHANGNDGNPATESLPWKTIQKAANSLKAGDTVVVSSGNYPERVIVRNSGSNGSVISFTVNGSVECRGFTIRADYILVKGFKVTSTTTTPSEAMEGIFIEGKFCIIEENYAYYNPRAGINVRPGSANCIIRNNRCHRNSPGINIDGTDHIIENNEVWGSRAYHTPTGYNAGDADGIRFWGSGHIFRGNYIHDIKYDDPENQGYSPHIDAFQTYKTASGAAGSNILIERNLIRLPYYQDKLACATGLTLADASYITFQNNIVFAFRGTDTVFQNNHHMRIENNTFIGSLTFPSAVLPYGILLKNCPYSTVKNNIIYDQVGQAIYLDGNTYTGLNIGYNCTYNSDGSRPRGTAQPHDLWKVNPRFVDPANNDFHIPADSPCIDAGATLSEITDDYDGNPRPIGGKYDIGAYEFQGISPIAAFTATPMQGAIPLQVSFDASASNDPAGSITAYNWDFGDGNSGTGKLTAHTYQNYGTFAAKLTVRNSDNQTVSISKNIKADAPPKASFVYNPNPGRLPVKVNYDASGSSDPDGQIVSYSWDFGDGGHGAGKNVSHSYAKEGTYTTTLTVKDNFGLDKSSSQTVTIVPTPVAIITGGPTKGRAPLSTAFNGSHSKSSQTGGKITSFAWDFGNGATATGNKVNHIYKTIGNFSVTLTVTDNKNKTQSKTIAVFVFSKPKAIFSYSPSIITPSTTVTFDGSASYDKYEAILSYRWSFGDGTTGTGSKLTHRFNKGGRNYTVNLTVTNVQGYKNSLSKSIFVSAK